MTRTGAGYLWVLFAGFSAVLLHAADARAQAAPGPGFSAVPAATCDMNAVAQTKAEFKRLSALRRAGSAAVSMETLRAASLLYVATAEACYPPHASGNTTIDAGGILLNSVPGTAQFGLNGRKWGSGSPFANAGVDANGPRSGGGTVTYSFMGDNVPGFEATEGGNPGTSVAVSSLATFAPCFIEEISNAFALWSAISNIRFVRVDDNGVGFNASGATGDIRIGAHVFDGPFGVLAHGYYPPPNGGSAAGDIHFDLAENWSCDAANGLDIGIVAAHEIGHAIGLEHEIRLGSTGRAALMNPTYNPFVAAFPLGDDINGAENLYGSAVGNSPDAIGHFGDNGIWIYDYGVGWTQLSFDRADQVATGDLDGNGVDEIIVDFGGDYGVWIYQTNAGWSQMTDLSPTFFAVGDLDDSGRDDIVANFEGIGIWSWMNSESWFQLDYNPVTVFAIGNLDGVAGDDVAFTFPGWGVWRWMNNSYWDLVHPSEADQIAIGNLDALPLNAATDADDLIMSFRGEGIYLSRNFSPAFQLFTESAAHLAAGDVSGDGRDELLMDLGNGLGVWVVDLLTGIRQLHPFDSEGFVLGDLDGNGQADVVVDFGDVYGLWLFVNNTTWVQMTPNSPEGLTIGDLN